MTPDRTPASFEERRRRGAATAALGAALGAGLLLTPAIAAGAEPVDLSAVYQVRFVGLRLGDADVRVNLNDTSYKITGEAKLSFLRRLVFELKGGMRASGKMAATGPRPEDYGLSFKTRKKKGHLTMTFKDNAVSAVSSQPVIKPHVRAIPLTKKHVRAVFDPMSAIFLAGRTERNGLDPSVCTRRLPIFDGKHRYDVQLSHIRTVKVEPRGRKGYNGLALVCRAKYHPIAGHRPHHKAVEFMVQTDEIEAWLIPVPQANLYVPYHVVIPTPWGTATVTAKAFEVERAGKEKIALVR